MSRDPYRLNLTETYDNRFVLWLVQDRQSEFVSRSQVEKEKLQWVQWVESFTLKGKVSREYYSDFNNNSYGKLRNIMIFTEQADAIMVKLAFDPGMFDKLD